MNYVKLAQTAKKLIEKNGNGMSFRKAGRAPADAEKPWRGPVTAASDPAEPTDPIAYDDVKAVIVPIIWSHGDTDPSALQGLSLLSQDIIERGLMTLYVAEQSFPTGHVDLKTLDTVYDGSLEWKIVQAQPLNPGGVELIYQMLLEH